MAITEIIDSDTQYRTARKEKRIFQYNGVLIGPERWPHVTALYSLSDEQQKQYKKFYDKALECEDILRATSNGKAFNYLKVEDPHWLRFQAEYLKRYPKHKPFKHKRSVRDIYSNAQNPCRQLIGIHYNKWIADNPRLHQEALAAKQAAATQVSPVGGKAKSTAATKKSAAV